MKANAPKKIYITNYDIPALPKDEQLSERWHEVRTQDTDIEYTRTDAFIEKAEEYIYKQLNEGRIKCGDIERFVEDIKIYMND